MKQWQSVPDPLASIIRKYCDVNALTARVPEQLRADVLRPGQEERAETVKKQLSEAIRDRMMTAAQYEDLTGMAMEDPDDEGLLLTQLKELWGVLFGEMEDQN